jgi:hypothetical protein
MFKHCGGNLLLPIGSLDWPGIISLKSWREATLLTLHLQSKEV